jgi:hypothetical protein
MPTVARLNITPVKSTALHHPDRIRLEPGGAVGDRLFFFVDGDGRRFSGPRAGRTFPIVARYDPDTDRLELRLPDGTVVSGDASPDGEAIVADFFGRPLEARVVDRGFTEPLTRFVGHRLRLARPERPGGAIDVHPVTLVSLESVAELGRRGGHVGALDAGRFRMTIEIQGVSGPHEEDAWAGRAVRVGAAVVRVGHPVPRCAVTTYDPATGVRDFPTLRVIRDYRGVNEANQLEFGVYADVLEPGEVRVGDPVDPLD